MATLVQYVVSATLPRSSAISVYGVTAAFTSLANHLLTLVFLAQLSGVCVNNAVWSCHLGANNLYPHFFTPLAIFPIALNTPAVSIDNVQVSIYFSSQESSHSAASSASWNNIPQPKVFRACHQNFNIQGKLLAVIFAPTAHSTGAVNAISLASSQRVSQTLYAH